MFQHCKSVTYSSLYRYAVYDIILTFITMLLKCLYSTLTPSLTGGNEAVERIMEYDESIRVIDKGLDLITMANQSILSVLADINAVMPDTLSNTAAILLNTSTELLSNAESLSDVVTTRLLPNVTKAMEVYELSENQTQILLDFVAVLYRDLNELTRAVSTNKDTVYGTLTAVQETLEVVEEIYESVSGVLPVLEENVTSGQLQLKEVQRVINNNSY